MNELNVNKRSTIANPLFQSSNFAVEDFTHNAMILAPAPPIPKEEPAIAIYSTDNRESVLQDIDNFSEVNLNSNTESTDIKFVAFSPLEDEDSLVQPNFQGQDNQANVSSGSQSITAGLSASFAQLPNVASTVLSTFSRVIKGSSPVPGEISLFDPQDQKLQIGQTQDDFNSYHSQLNQPIEPSAQDFSASVVPTFYSPTDPTLSKSVQNPTQVASNTFRLGGIKKKAYAHIPGLSTTATSSYALQTPDNVSTQAPQSFTSPVHEPPITNLFGKLPSEPSFIQPSFSSDSVGRPPSSNNSNAIGLLLENSTPTFQCEQSVLHHQNNPSPPPPPPSLQPFYFNTKDSLLVESSPSVNESVTKLDTFIDKPTFFSTDKVPVTTKQALGKSENPYSKSKIGKTAVYKNPSLIPFAERPPIIFDSAAQTNNSTSNLENVKTESTQPNIGSFFTPSITDQNFSCDFVGNSSIDFNQSTVHPTKPIEGLSTDPVSINHPEALTTQLTPLLSPSTAESVIQSHFVQEHLFNQVNVQPIPTVHPFKNIEGLSTDPVSINHPEALTTQLILDQTPSTTESVFQHHFVQEPLSFNQVSVQPIPPVNFFENKENQQSAPEIDSKLFEDLSTSSIWATVSGSLNNNKVSCDSKEKTNTNDLNRNNSLNTSNKTNTVTQRNDDEIPRFNQDISENSLFCINNNSAVLKSNQIEKQYPTFFDTTTSATNNPTFESKNNNSLLYYFSNPSEEKITNQEVVTDDNHQSVKAAQTSSFSSFKSESDSELNQDLIDYDELPEEMMDEIDSENLGKSPTDMKYRPVYYHWFYQIEEVPTKIEWNPFSMKDSMALEEAFKNPNDACMLIPTDGGRCDVNVQERKRVPVYWKGNPNIVRRCSWFFKALDSKFVPYEEEVAEKLEEEYRRASTIGEWHKKISLPNGETVVFHGPTVIVHFLQSQNPDSWGSSAQPTNRPRVVKRGIEDFNIEDGECEKIDHLLFMIHGIGKVCDLKFRTIEEAVDEFRNIAIQLVQSHYRNSCDLEVVNRVEILPISWHTELHSEEFGIDEKLKLITLESIPKLRTFANETLLDILFYSSPVFCQHIMDIVSNTMNRLFSIFKKRNPGFSGGVSLGGHSLGSLILFDLLCHQKETVDLEMENSENPNEECSVGKTMEHPNLNRQTSQTVNYTMGIAGTGQPFINYPQLSFKVHNFFALGSPISMFVTVRGIDKLGLDFKLPTCDGFFNIFHPYDPVAYRCEPLICSSLSNVSPVLIPHHKGRKRMHLELKETMVRIGTDIKERILFTFKNTVQAVHSLTSKKITEQQIIEKEVDKVLTEQILTDDIVRVRSDSVSTNVTNEMDVGETDLPLGKLNKSRRVDFVLQEAPLEFFNEYLFALTSHVCYWESEDTILFMMKEIYTSMGIQTDGQIPQHTLTIERPSTSATMSPTLPSSSDRSP